MRLTVIIPAYNAEKYISRAIESVLHQTHSDIELIVINDGSTDDTSNITKSYGRRIRYFYQENKGVADARNIGIEMSSGDFIAFLDSDDYILPIMYEKMLDVAQSTCSDIVSCTFCLENENGKRRHALPLKEGWYDTNNRKDIRLAFRDLGNSCCNRIFRRSLIKEIKFPKLKRGEDSLFLLESFLKATRISYINEPLYIYFQNSSSATKNEVNLEVIEEYKQIQSNKKALVIKYNQFEVLKRVLQDYYIRTFLMYSNIIRQIKDENQKNLCWTEWLAFNNADFIKGTPLHLIISFSQNISWVYFAGMIITGIFITPFIDRIKYYNFYVNS